MPAKRKSTVATQKQRQRQRKHKRRSKPPSKDRPETLSERRRLDQLDHQRLDSQDADVDNAAQHDQASVEDSDTVCSVLESKPPPDLSVRGIISSMRLQEEDREKMSFIHTLPLKEQIIELVYDRLEAALYFKNKSVTKEEVEELRLECDDRVKRILV